MPQVVLEGMTAACFFVSFLPSRVRRPSSGARLRELHNQARLRAGKPPLPE